MLTANITLEQIAGVFRIYEKVMGGNTRYERPEQVLEMMQQVGVGQNRFSLEEGYRFGSRYSMHTKLQFEIGRDGSVKPIADPNMDRDDSQIRNANRAAKRFEQEVKKYFETGQSHLLVEKPKKVKAPKKKPDKPNEPILPGF